MYKQWRTLAVVVLLMCATISCRQQPAPASSDANFWRTPTTALDESIDHSVWQQVLDAAVVDVADGLNRVNYAALANEHQDLLARYIATLASIDPRGYAQNEQMAYWINMYNAVTVQRVARDWPVDSILNVGSRTRQGPWDESLVTVAGVALSLNDIEHGILRRVWDEPRIHFAVNCASIGCPDLSAVAYTGDNLEAQLQQAAQRYLASERGVLFNDSTLQLSAIFKWYVDDFGKTEADMITAIAALAESPTRERLLRFDGAVTYDYDWSINAQH